MTHIEIKDAYCRTCRCVAPLNENGICPHCSPSQIVFEAEYRFPWKGLAVLFVALMALAFLVRQLVGPGD
ncbi:MAG: hypothetical protein KF831_06750 [Acidobacteria bacterium]|nr:hypothetical protein [Acidobacteriota bacterium]